MTFIDSFAYTFDGPTLGLLRIPVAVVLIGLSVFGVVAAVWTRRIGEGRGIAPLLVTLVALPLLFVSWPWITEPISPNWGEVLSQRFGVEAVPKDDADPTRGSGSEYLVGEQECSLQVWPKWHNLFSGERTYTVSVGCPEKPVGE